MAASVKNMAGASDGSSSSSSDDDDGEALKRCQEAVWESRTVKEKEDSNVKDSKRVVVANHEHDGNELQVSQGFRMHVAKKLGHFLDSCISETKTKSLSCLASVKCDDEDEGFRLFSTSVPGQTAEEPPPPVRRRPIPSSSDSDSEMETRLREAAVSVKDLLPSSTLPSTLPPSLTWPPSSGKIKKKKNLAEEEEYQIVKKKKKRRQTQEESVQMDCASSPNTKNSGEQENSEQEHPQVKIKQKKKKKKNCEGHAMEVALH